MQDGFKSTEYRNLKVVEMVVQQYCSVGDAFLGPHKHKWHHSLCEVQNIKDSQRLLLTIALFMITYYRGT